MGLGQSERASRTYISVLGSETFTPEGKPGAAFTIRVPEGTPGAISRENKQKDIVHELRYGKLEGQLTKIELRDSNDYGKQWNITFTSYDEKTGAAEEFVLSTGFSSRYSKSLFLRLLNMTPAELSDATLRLEPYYFERKDKPNKYASGLSVFIGDRKIDGIKDENMPPLDEIVVKGKNTFDDTKQVNWIWEKLQAQVLPHLGNVSSWFDTTPAVQNAIDMLKADPAASKHTPEQEEESGELPF